MTLEEIRRMCDDSHDDASFRARQMVSKRDLAALLVRAVEALVLVISPDNVGFDDERLRNVELQVSREDMLSARSFLRELGVEA